MGLFDDAPKDPFEVAAEANEAWLAADFDTDPELKGRLHEEWRSLSAAVNGSIGVT